MAAASEDVRVLRPIELVFGSSLRVQGVECLWDSGDANGRSSDPGISLHAAHRRIEVWNRRVGVRSGALRAQSDVPPLVRCLQPPPDTIPAIRLKRTLSEPHPPVSNKARKALTGERLVQHVPRPLQGTKRARLTPEADVQQRSHIRPSPITQS